MEKAPIFSRFDCCSTLCFFIEISDLPLYDVFTNRCYSLYSQIQNSSVEHSKSLSQLSFNFLYQHIRCFKTFLSYRLQWYGSTNFLMRYERRMLSEDREKESCKSQNFIKFAKSFSDRCLGCSRWLQCSCNLVRPKKILLQAFSRKN